MAEKLYYNDKLFEAIDRYIISLHLIGERLSSDYKEEEKRDIEQTQKLLRRFRLISHPVKSIEGRYGYCCKHCGKLLPQGKSECFCQYCGSYNTTVQFPPSVKFLQYMGRIAVEGVLAETSVSASNPAPFLTGLDLIETVTRDRRRYFEKIVKIRVKTNEPDQYSYCCGACDFKINSDKEKIFGLNFCPNCGIPFRRTRRITQQENGEETTVFTS